MDDIPRLRNYKMPRGKINEKHAFCYSCRRNHIIPRPFRRLKIEIRTLTSVYKIVSKLYAFAR